MTPERIEEIKQMSGWLLPSVAIELLDAFEEEKRVHRKTLTSLPDELYQKAAELDQIKAGNHPDWLLRSTEDMRDINLLEVALEEAQHKERSLKKFQTLASDNHTLAARFERELAEAQQTIARQQLAMSRSLTKLNDALNFPFAESSEDTRCVKRMIDKAVSLISSALGNKQGSDKP